LEQKVAEQNQLMAALIEQNEALAAELAKLGKELTDLRARAASGGTKGGQ
jgi:ribosomal protein L29